MLGDEAGGELTASQSSGLRRLTPAMSLKRVEQPLRDGGACCWDPGKWPPGGLRMMTASVAVDTPW